MEMNTNTRVALVTKPIPGKFEHIEDGKSGNEQQVYEGHFATLMPTPDHTDPAILKLYYNSASPMMVINKFTENKKKRTLFNQLVKKNASRSTGYYDPSNVGIPAKRALKAPRPQKAQQNALTEFNPKTPLGAYISEYSSPIGESVGELRAENEALKAEVNHQIETVFAMMEMVTVDFEAKLRNPAVPEQQPYR
jgi:hypothetical protein